MSNFHSSIFNVLKLIFMFQFSPLSCSCFLKSCFSQKVQNEMHAIYIFKKISQSDNYHDCWGPWTRIMINKVFLDHKWTFLVTNVWVARITVVASTPAHRHNTHMVTATPLSHTLEGSILNIRSTFQVLHTQDMSFNLQSNEWYWNLLLLILNFIQQAECLSGCTAVCC